MTLVVLAIILLVLFVAAFVMKRRFGVLGLALASGVVLAQYASSLVSGQLQPYGEALKPFSATSVAIMGLTLLPALILLTGGPVYTKRHSAIVGAIGFALFGVVLILGPLSTAIPPGDMQTRSIVAMIGNWQEYIVIAGIVLALIDTFMVHNAAAKHQKAAKH